MQTYPYNRESAEGRRLHKLLDVGFNPSSLESTPEQRFDMYDVPVVTQCEAVGLQILLPSGLTGIKRPHVRIEGVVQQAWGDFADDLSALDFEHGETLPISYTHPIEDDTMKMMIDAGFYSDKNFEPLMVKLVAGEKFDADCDMRVLHIDIPDEELDRVPVVLIDPVSVVHETFDPSENTTIQSMLRRASMVAIELRAEGIQTNELLTQEEVESEVYAPMDFTDALTEQSESRKERDENERLFVERSPLLGEEIDVTPDIANVYGMRRTSEDARIEEIKQAHVASERDEDEIEL